MDRHLVQWLSRFQHLMSSIGQNVLRVGVYPLPFYKDLRSHSQCAQSEVGRLDTTVTTVCREVTHYTGTLNPFGNHRSHG